MTYDFNITRKQNTKNFKLTVCGEINPNSICDPTLTVRQMGKGSRRRLGFLKREGLE